MEELSFWPKENVFNSSGLWVGWWTPDCESWYQNRLEDIRMGRADLKKSSEWRKAITMHRKAQKLNLTNIRNSEMYLDGLGDT